MNLSLYTRVMISIGSVLLISMLALAYVLFDDLKEEYLSKQALRASINIQRLVEDGREALLDDVASKKNDFHSVTQFFLEYRKDKSFAFALLENNDGEILVDSSAQGEIPRDFTIDLDSPKAIYLEYQGRPVMVLGAPIIFSSKTLGIAYIAYFQDVNVFLETNKAKRIALTLLGMWFFLLMATHVGLRKSIKPLSVLTNIITTTSFEKSAQAVTNDLRERKDEIGILACAFDAMLSDLRNSYSDMEKREAHYRQLVETANVIPWELDLNSRRIIYVGPQAERILGYDIKDWYEEKFWLNHVCHDDVEKADAFYRSVASEGKEGEVEYRIQHANGQLVWVRDWVHKSVVNPRSPTLQGFMFDVDEKVKARTELQRYREHLENLVNERTAELLEVNQELQSFAHSLSQDLRVPLRVINGFSQAMLEDYGDKVGEEGQSYLKRICGGTQKMGEMIEDILMLSRVTRADIYRRTVDFTALAERIAADLEKEYENHKVEFEVEEEMSAYGDEELLKIVLENLLSNAWKFTAKVAHPKVLFSSEIKDDKVIYSVRDNGAGFDMQYADKLFLPFRRLHNSEEFEGTGVGLATVKRIILRHGGEVWGEGTLGEGAVFSFSLGKSPELG